MSEMGFRNATEATLWFNVNVYTQTAQHGASDSYAATRADEALKSWRERNPHGYEIIQQVAEVKS